MYWTFCYIEINFSLKSHSDFILFRVFISVEYALLSHPMTYSWALGLVLKETELTTVLVDESHWDELSYSQKTGYPHVNASGLQNDKQCSTPAVNNSLLRFCLWCNWTNISKCLWGIQHCSVWKQSVTSAVIKWVIHHLIIDCLLLHISSWHKEN